MNRVKSSSVSAFSLVDWIWASMRISFIENEEITVRYKQYTLLSPLDCKSNGKKTTQVTEVNW